LDPQLRNVSFSSSLEEKISSIEVSRSLRKIIIFNLLLLKHIGTAFFKKLPSSETDFFISLSHLVFIFPQMRNMEFEEWHNILSWIIGNHQSWRERWRWKWKSSIHNSILIYLKKFVSFFFLSFFLSKILEEKQS